MRRPMGLGAHSIDGELLGLDRDDPGPASPSATSSSPTRRWRARWRGRSASGRPWGDDADQGDCPDVGVFEEYGAGGIDRELSGGSSSDGRCLRSSVGRAMIAVINA